MDGLHAGFFRSPRRFPARSAVLTPAGRDRIRSKRRGGCRHAFGEGPGPPGPMRTRQRQACAADKVKAQDGQDRKAVLASPASSSGMDGARRAMQEKVLDRAHPCRSRSASQATSGLPSWTIPASGPAPPRAAPRRRLRAQDRRGRDAAGPRFDDDTGSRAPAGWTPVRWLVRVGLPGGRRGRGPSSRGSLLDSGPRAGRALAAPVAVAPRGREAASGRLPVSSVRRVGRLPRSSPGPRISATRRKCAKPLGCAGCRRSRSTDASSSCREALGPSRVVFPDAACRPLGWP
jgi:hypothetical protein